MKRRAGCLAAIFVLTTLSGCGVKGPPMPPVIRVADPTRDLAVYQDDRHTVLSWSYPSSTTSGESLHDLESIQIWRATLLEVEAPPPGEKPSEKNLNRQLLLSNGEMIAELDDAGLEAATRGSLLEWRDDLEVWRRNNPSDEPQMLWYAVRSVCCRGRESGLSNIARLVPEIPPAPPTEFAVTAEEDGIRLRWTPNGGIPVLIERSPDTDRWRPLGTRTIDADAWLDRTAAQGSGWNYRLRSVRTPEGGPRIVGPPGPAAGLFYPDIYPPPTPHDLVCLPEGTRVRLRWRAGEEGLLHHIYRSTDGAETMVLVDDLDALQYEDLAPPPGTSVYEITAVDGAGNESAPATCTAARGASR
ncbi:MAG: lipoprotein [Thermoanaerobaculales bacterium]|jgi:predicted small lipoprotein YifL|nr:lipoprotein [Thermoanaerobaculales bacterium]